MIKCTPHHHHQIGPILPARWGPGEGGGYFTSKMGVSGAYFTSKMRVKGGYFTGKMGARGMQPPS